MPTQKFMCSHSFPPGTLTREKVQQVADAIQQESKIQAQCSFLNLSAGKVFCVLEAPDQRTVAAFFQRLNVPADSILPVELEGERGVVREVGTEATLHA